jgi:predicted enzyme involved in methoxymalonyl-ACP biosynthesis
MIAVVICRPQGQNDRRTWTIDTWLMSCRVLGRKVEEAMLTEVVKAAEARGVSRLIGTFIPTAKNSMVSDLYARLGFRETTASSDGTRTFELEVAAFERKPLPITLVDGAGKHQDAA